MTEGDICGSFRPSFILLLAAYMVYDPLAKVKNLFIRFFIAIALLLLFLAVGDPTSFIFLSPWETRVILCKALSLLTLFRKRKEEEKRNPRGIPFYYTSFLSA
jgi:hypothetical protein